MFEKVQEFVFNSGAVIVCVVIIAVMLMLALAPCWIGGGALYLGDRALDIVEQDPQK